MNNRIRSYFSRNRSSIPQPAVIPTPTSIPALIPTSAPAPIPTFIPTSTSRDSPVSQHLHAAKEILQDVTSDAGITKAEIHVLEQDASEILRLVRCRRNRLTPINQIPPEVLTLIPDFWNEDVRDRTTIALTHVCQALREVFISRTSLWTDFYCEDADETHMTLDCSGSEPANAWFESYQDPPLQVSPHAIARLKSVVIHGSPKKIQDTTAQLSHPAPLLESLRFEGEGLFYSDNGQPVIATTLFDGDLSSLRDLHLKGIRTELPWRNMVNLTSFTLIYMSRGDPSVNQLLDFFESAPRLRKVQLQLTTRTSGVQTGRLVSLACLKRMDIIGSVSPALLLDHLLIPADAKLTDEANLEDPTHPSNSLGTIMGLTGFRVHMHVREFYPSVRFTGPFVETSIVPATPRVATTCRVLESLAQFDPSKTERLKLTGGDILLRDGCTVYGVLLPMKSLRVLTISRCKNLSFLFSSLDDIHVCPKLEELILDARSDGEKLNIQGMIKMAATRSTMLVKLKSVMIVSRDKFVQSRALKLKEYVPHVECGPRVALVSDANDSSDEED